MNTSPRFHPERVSTRVAAAALVVLALAFAGPGRAQQVAAASPTGEAPAAALPVPAALPGVPSPNLALEALGMGDMVRITVFRNPDLTTEAKVSERGTILFPLIGEVPVVGMTPAQAGARIAKQLQDGRFVVNPEVSVSLYQVNSRQVSVLGNVNKPGRYPLDSQNVKLTDFLAVAGGIAAPGSDRVTIISTQDGRTTKKDIDLAAMFRNGDVSQNVQLHAGDTVFVEKAPMVYIYGEVQRAGAYRLEPHMTVMQVLALGGGVTPRGTERGIKIQRREQDGKVARIDARLTDPVQTDDVVYVHESLF
jgi:polysaccharide export outer membrane protein